VPVEIRVNNRKILAALAEVCGGADKMVDITVAIDKLDKIGIDKVKDELVERGLTSTQIATIEQFLTIAGSNEAKLHALKSLFAANPTGLKGIEELEYLLSYAADLAVDLTLARGLNYYTGVIFEVKAIGVQMGSIGGGGRYDDLTGTFGVPNIPGVGISFGIDRIYDVMEELKVFPEDVHTGTRVLFFNLGEAESRAAFGLLQQVREKGVAAELYHETAKFDKQFKYAEKKGIPYIVILGNEELVSGNCKVKDLRMGQQTEVSQAELPAFLSQ
ncbi:MAG TPA: ATP phosphoribosyltransferase regulatory subunit, partial [Puia sp.]